ncbi:MAG: class I SAM-dependent rRNA methyltransferase [Planctomycetota bacterium]|nr:MAG: class I SAM-dependent rRNA methyltransferase [Planctomycetota bacterium]
MGIIVSAAVPTVWLRPRRALPFFSRHPWVFAGAIGRIEETPVPGAVVRLATAEGEFVAWGLWNPASAIRVRLYSWDEDQRLDEAFWFQRVREAVAARRRLFGDGPAWRAGRMVSSEGDSLSGLTVDCYADHLLIQWTSLALSLREAVIVEALNSELASAGIWRRTDTGVVSKEGLPRNDGLVMGHAPPSDLTVVEHGIQYQVDIVEGQKTGFYFDQRDNRMAVAQLCQGRRVLDVCSYTGGFALTAAAVGQAASVHGIDGSAPAIERATGNAARNGLADRVTFEKADAYRFLEQAIQRGERYDVIVLDPPKMAKAREQIDSALRGYHGLNTLALRVLAEGGVLATCSCSGLIDRGQFESVLAEAALSANRRLRIIDSRGAAPDHPVSVHCPESAYLKCVLTLA